MSPIKHQSFFLQRILKLGVLLAILAFAIAYVSWQARYLIGGPELSVSEDVDTIQNERTIILEGIAQNVTNLELNGRAITVNPEGSFSEKVVLENGYTIVSIDATDRYGRSIHWEKPFIYQNRNEVVKR